VDVVFAGAGLATNRYFDRERHLFHEVESATLRKRNLRAVGKLLKGTAQSWQLLRKEKPDLIVGFGSFHACPLLLAAWLARVPMVLFESNALPGRVTRLFSRPAVCTAVYFKEAMRHLKGKSIEVSMPRRAQGNWPSQQDAKRALGLDPDKPLLLALGGSQGATAINRAVRELLAHWPEGWQLMHCAGSEEEAEATRLLCKERGIRYYLRAFEPEMARAWQAADLALCRAGALTLSEVMEHAVPAVLVPYPFAADQHQLHNARCLEKRGGWVMTETALEAGLAPLLRLMQSEKEREGARAALRSFQEKARPTTLADLVRGVL
jgi:UDP-N-acetylglucosamine--N-acetylmuramyl-(pentapeptide) pyrophosphoryl-undecaprenol N-acetylglucosamine transferase